MEARACPTRTTSPTRWSARSCGSWARPKRSCTWNRRDAAPRRWASVSQAQSHPLLALLARGSTLTDPPLVQTHGAATFSIAQARVRPVSRARDRGLQGVGTTERAPVDRRRGRARAGAGAAVRAHRAAAVRWRGQDHLQAPAAAELRHLAAAADQAARGAAPARALGPEPRRHRGAGGAAG